MGLGSIYSDHPICFSQPRLVAESFWISHIPFAMTLVDLLRPATIVELGVYRGVSYCAFCQAVQQLGLTTRCYAIDSWSGDEHNGYYGSEVLEELKRHHDPLYSGFSTLIQATFDHAVGYFEDTSVDLLHIDGYHTYEEVKHDFETWLPKMSARGVVLFHDTNTLERDYGVWKLWAELKARYPTFEFSHGNGLGVLASGTEVASPIQRLIDAPPTEAYGIRQFFFHLGSLLDNESKHRASIDAQHEYAESLESTLSAKNDIIAEATSYSRTLEKYRDDKDVELGELWTKYREQAELLTSANRNIIELQESLERSQHESNEQRAEHEARLRELQMRYHEQSDEVRASHEATAYLQQQLERARVGADEARADWEARLRELQLEHHDHLVRLGEAQERIEALETELGQARSQLQERRSTTTVLSARQQEDVASFDTTSPSLSEVPVFCTIISKNYIAAARVLAESVRAFHPDATFVTLLVDGIDGYFRPEGEPFAVLLASELGIPNWPHFSFKYDILELNTAVKPYFLEVLFQRYSAQKVIYFDPDIVVYHPLDVLFSLLDDHMAIVTPHILEPLLDGYNPNELVFLQVGTFNLGFFALSRTGQWRELLRWWQERVYTLCTREAIPGVFVDQHWMDLIPSLFEGVHVLRDPGFNVAYWNLKHRQISRESSGYTINGSALKFMHFSGFSVDRPSDVSQHQNRYAISDLSLGYKECFADYRVRLLKNGFEESRHWPYAYSCFPDGIPITPMLRTCLRENDALGERWPNPFYSSTTSSFRDWALQPAIEQGLQYVSPYLLTIYRSRQDLQRVFPHVPGSHEHDLAKWFAACNEEINVPHPVYTQPVRDALGRKEPSPTDSNEAQVVRSRATRTQRQQRRTLQRLNRARRYYVSFPTNVKPFLPKNALAVLPSLYTGPSGLYGGIRKALKRLHMLRVVRRVVGLRIIMTARMYFSNSLSEQCFPPGWSADRVPNFVSDGHASRVDSPRESTESSASTTVPPVKGSLGVNIIGYAYSETGVGQQVRNMLCALETALIPVAVHPIESYDLSRKEDWEAKRFSRELVHPISVFHANADMTFAVRDLVGPHVYRGRYNIGFWSWELSRFPDRWKRCIGFYDEIWVPSNFIRDTLIVHSAKPVTVVPICIQPESAESLDRTELGVTPDTFVVLFVFDALSVVERKNPWAAIDAFERAFSRDERHEKARLIIKVTNVERFPGEAWRLRRRMQDVNGLLLEGYYSRSRTNALVNLCDAYVSLHRSEGYGLTIAEAMYLGKPVIVTAYSGNMDFCTPENSYLVPYRLQSLGRDYPPYDSGAVWAEADVSEAAALLRQVYEQPEQARLRGSIAAQDIRLSSNPKVVGDRLRTRLHEILQIEASGNNHQSLITRN